MKDENKVKRLLQTLKAQMTTEKELQIVKYCEEKLEATKEIDGEEWRDIVGYEGLYQISNFGRIKSFHYKNPSVLRVSISNSGYKRLVLSKNGKYESVCIHVLVAKAFIPNLENKREVNHKDGDKSNNCVDNLEWVTRSENMKHAHKNKLLNLKYGAENPIAKLTVDDVEYIRKNYKSHDKNFSGRALARKFGVSNDTIYKVVKYQKYK